MQTNWQVFLPGDQPLIYSEHSLQSAAILACKIHIRTTYVETCQGFSTAVHRPLNSRNNFGTIETASRWPQLDFLRQFDAPSSPYTQTSSLQRGRHPPRLTYSSRSQHSTAERRFMLFLDISESSETSLLSLLFLILQQIEALNTCHNKHNLAKFWGKVSHRIA